MTFSEASKAYAVPLSTLKNRKEKPIPRRAGAEQILTDEEEKILQKWLDEGEELGDPRSRLEIPKVSERREGMIEYSTKT